MADIRINSLPTTATSTSFDDYVAVDGSGNGTRKLSVYSPTFGGNLTVSGTGGGTFTGPVTFGSPTNIGSASAVWMGGNGSSGAFFNVPTGANIQLGINNSGLVSVTSTATTLQNNLTVSGTGTSSFAGVLQFAPDVWQRSGSTDRLYFSSAADRITYLKGGPAAGTGTAVTIRNGADATVASFSGNGDTSVTGNLTVSGGTITGGNGTANAFLTANSGSANQGGIKFQQASSDVWSLQTYTAGGDIRLYNYSTGSALIVESATKNATLAGNLTVSGSANALGGTNTGNSEVLALRGSGTTAQLRIAGAGADYVKYLALGFNTTSNYGWIDANQAGTGVKPLVVNPSGGNLLIGTTTDGGQKLQVSGTANISSTLTVNGAAANYALNAVGFVEAQGTTSSKGFRIYNTANGEAVNFQSNGITQTYDGTFDISSSNTTGLRIYGNAGSPLWRWVPWNGGSAGIVTNDSSGYINTSKSLPLLPITAPAAPASGWLLYTDSADSNKLKAKASTGTVVTLGTP